MVFTAQTAILLVLIGFGVGAFVLAIMAGTGTITHLVIGSFHHHGLRRTVALSLGVVAGAQLGAHISLRLHGRIIHWLLAVALVALSARLLIGA
ncbi:MAG TPA: hypothetical protein VJ838_03555 [Gaiellaceae bacterium]|nr:hypothetical protein [Gaiellaceae bacterium]